jgi:hypothetical protein
MHQPNPSQREYRQKKDDHSGDGYTDGESASKKDGDCRKLSGPSIVKSLTDLCRLSP